MERRQHMRVLFDVAYTEGSKEEMTQRDFIEQLQAGLAREWWSDNSGADWYVVAMYEIEEDGTMTPFDPRLKRRIRSVEEGVTDLLNQQVRLGTVGSDTADVLEGLIRKVLRRFMPSMSQIDERQRHEVMVDGIVSALTVGGYDVSGVASQAQIEELQQVFEDADAHIGRVGRVIGEIASNQGPV